MSNDKIERIYIARIAPNWAARTDLEEALRVVLRQRPTGQPLAEDEVAVISFDKGTKYEVSDFDGAISVPKSGNAKVEDPTDHDYASWAEAAFYIAQDLISDGLRIAQAIVDESTPEAEAIVDHGVALDAALDAVHPQE